MDPQQISIIGPIFSSEYFKIFLSLSMILFFCFSIHVMSPVDNLTGLSLFLEFCLCLLHNINVYFTTLVFAFVFLKGQFNLLVYFSPCSCKRFHILTRTLQVWILFGKSNFYIIYLNFIRQFLLAHFGFYNLRQIGRIPANLQNV